MTSEQVTPSEITKITKATLTSGEAISIAEGLTVLVGPNNAGKSQLLREIQQRLSGSANSANYHPKVISALDFEKRCSPEQLIVWMKGNYRFLRSGGHLPGAFPEERFPLPKQDSALSATQIKQIWGETYPHMHQVADFLMAYMPAGSQANTAGSTGTYHVGREVPSNPVQKLFSDRSMEQKVSDEMRRVFGEELVVHRYAGSRISLHIGKVSSQETTMPASEEYLREIEALPLLEEQGDGVRSFMGVVLALTTASYPIVLIDEPETFLHPPQAYMLGQFLARQHDNGTQVVVATHSDDVLRGIVSIKGNEAAVTVVRLTRSRQGNHAAQVHVQDVQKLYEDPLIKYYGILDGLFFHGVILCEADSDCTYYRAVLESTVDSLDGGHPATALSLHFAHSGGKSRMPHAVRALRASKVPVACAVDIDFLQMTRDFDELVKACGGDPTTLERHRRVVTSAIDARAEKVDKTIAKVKIEQVFEARRDSTLTSGDINRIKGALAPQSGWKIFKAAADTILRGDAATAYQELNAALRKLGIFLVPVGELEGFHKSIPAENKGAWLREALGSFAYKSSPEATSYVKSMANFIWNNQDQAANIRGHLVGEKDSTQTDQ
ncbi:MULTISPECIES: ATP-dependent endonuclease [unclassified Micromonospora]|uniref:ATP-dependent nuclease n=1 Tax=unclassified Micromonospora TaxID=2617518 RepID=UPI00362A5099